jgi:hypothetical protein
VLDILLMLRRCEWQDLAHHPPLRPLPNSFLVPHILRHIRTKFHLRFAAEMGGTSLAETHLRIAAETGGTSLAEAHLRIAVEGSVPFGTADAVGPVRLVPAGIEAIQTTAS